VKLLKRVLFSVSVICLSSLAQSPACAQTQGTGGPSYTSAAGRSPTAPGVATSTNARPGAVPIQSNQPTGARTILNPSASEFGTPIPGVTTR
jgi:hypothetical protein